MLYKIVVSVEDEKQLDNLISEMEGHCVILNKEKIDVSEIKKISFLKKGDFSDTKKIIIRHSK